MSLRITLVLDDLLGGGAARVAQYLSDAWALDGRIVTILTNDDGSVPPHYQLSPAVKHHPLGLRRNSPNFLIGALANCWRILKLRRAIVRSRPDVVISFLDGNNILCLLATRGLNSRIIVSERTDPHARSIGRAWETLRRLTYPWAYALVTQTEHAMTYFSAQIRSHGRVIPNPVALPDEAAVITERADRKKIVSVGSLRKVKGHDLLIDAFALIANQNPAWDLEIYGEGGERHNLESQIERLGLKDRVSLCGHVASPISKLRMADLFALPSRAEGFPNALAEAMACGLPVVSFDCRSGPSDLIRPGIDGLLVAPGDVAAFAAALASLIKDPNQRIQFGSRAPEVLERFGLVRILALWEELLHGASTKPC